MAKLTAGIATHHVSGLCLRFAAGFMEAWPDNVNPSPIMQPPEPQLLTDLKCQVIDWPVMNVHGGGGRIDTSSSRRETNHGNVRSSQESPE